MHRSVSGRAWSSLLAGLACMVVLQAALAAAATDYAREERWAKEVVPAVMVGEPVWLATAKRPRVLALLAQGTGRPKGGIVLVHGLGVNPDFGMIGALRGTLAEAGYVTLSVQMPVLAADAPREDYAATFPEAGERIAAAVAFLRDRNVGRIAVVSHSMGASMADAYLAQPGATKVDAWIPVGMLAPFSSHPRMPVLDVMAEGDLAQVKDNAPARRKALPADACSGAGHDCRQRSLFRAWRRGARGGDRQVPGARERGSLLTRGQRSRTADRLPRSGPHQSMSSSSAPGCVARCSRSRTANHCGSSGMRSIRIARTPARSRSRRLE